MCRVSLASTVNISDVQSTSLSAVNNTEPTNLISKDGNINYESKSNISNLTSSQNEIHKRGLSSLFVNTNWTIYTFLIVIGSANLLIILLAARTQVQKHCSTNLYILNLAIADAALISTLPFLLSILANEGQWRLGDTACRLYWMAEQSNKSASILFVLALAFDRYCAICHPGSANRWSTKFVTTLVSVACWVFVIGLLLPVYLYAGVSDMSRRQPVTINGSTSIASIERCVITWPRPEQSAAGANTTNPYARSMNEVYYVIFCFIVLYVMPTLLILTLYSLILKELWNLNQKRSRMVSIHSSNIIKNSRSISGVRVASRSKDESYSNSIGMSERRKTPRQSSASPCVNNEPGNLSTIIERNCSTLSFPNNNIVEISNDCSNINDTDDELTHSLHAGNCNCNRQRHSRAVRLIKGFASQRNSVAVSGGRIQTYGSIIENRGFYARLTNMIVCVGILHLLCWTPYWIFSILFMSGSLHVRSRRTMELIMALMHVLPYANSAFNPICYGGLNKKYQRCLVGWVLGAANWWRRTIKCCG